MKNKILYLKLIILIIITFSSVSFSNLQTKDYFLANLSEEFVLVEQNTINKSFISYLYKDKNNNYLSKIYDYNTLEEINLKTIIKEDKINLYNEKINELIRLKYPKFIADTLIEEDAKKSYLFKDNELIIYFNDYDIEPSISEVLYLKVNYNEIKDYLDFTLLLDKTHENESGYNYTSAKKSIAITFDDSPNKNKTNKILEYLKDNHFHATFFVVGEKCLNNEDLLLSIKSNGNEIGSHTYKHQNIKNVTDIELEEDYNKVNSIYKRLFNEDIRYLRPPYGSYKKSQLNVLDVSFILWSLDTLDWKYRNSDYLINYVLDNVSDGDIILFHDSYDSTVKAIEELLPLLYSKGYQVMSIKELAEIKKVDIENNKVYNKFN